MPTRWGRSTAATAGSIPPTVPRGGCRSGSVELARERLAQAGVLEEPGFLATLQALLEVLPPSRTFTGFDPAKGSKGAVSDFEALEKLRRAVLAEKVPEPRQLDMFRKQVA